MRFSKLLLLLFTLLSFSSQSQETITIPAENYPFSDIVEWKGMGAILFNSDPDQNTRKVYMTLVTDQPASVWNQSFNPKGFEYYMIYGENTRYVYFLDNLELQDNKYSFNQLNEAGTVKSSSSDLLTLFKRLGNFLPEDTRVQDIVVTDKALVHLFIHHDKKEKKYTQIAVFMTHHNRLTYGVVLGEKTEDELKNERIGTWKYIGFDGEDVLFAARDVIDKKAGWAIKRYTSKAELKETSFVDMPKADLEMISNTGFGTTGNNYLDNEATSEQGILRTVNGKLYLTAIESENGKRMLGLWNWNAGSWEKLRTQPLGEAPKKGTKLGVYALNEGLGVHLDEGNDDRVIFLPFDQSMAVNVIPYSKNLVFNPGRYLIPERTSEFALILPAGKLFFDRSQLNRSGDVKFEFIRK